HIQQDMTPVMNEKITVEEIVELPAVVPENTGDKNENSIIHFELSSDTDPITAVHTPPAAAEIAIPKQKSNQKEKEASTAPTSGGYLAKPSQIYVEEALESNTVEESTPLLTPLQADEPVLGM